MSREREYDYGLEPDERFEPDDGLDVEAFDRSLPHVMTVLGPIRPEQLGVTLVHEHVIARPPRRMPGGSDPEPNLILDDPHAALAELEDLYAAGGRAVVDATVADAGRDIAAVRWVAARAPVHVIAVTGYGAEAFSGRSPAGRSSEDVAAECIAELTTGIGDTGVRAGAILIGAGRDLVSPPEEVGLRGGARAHRATAAPLMIEWTTSTMALDWLAILADEGVDPARIILCHPDVRVDDGVLRSVLATGVWVSFGQFSPETPAGDEDRAAVVARLIADGFGGRILLAGDLARRSSLRAYGGGPGLIYSVESFPLMLMAAGVDAPTVRQLLIENPAKALTIQ